MQGQDKYKNSYILNLVYLQEEGYHRKGMSSGDKQRSPVPTAVIVAPANIAERRPAMSERVSRIVSSILLHPTRLVCLP